MMWEETFANFFCLVLIIIVVVAGILGNAFITIASALCWIRSQTLSPSDMILMVLSLSRIPLLGIILSIHCILFFSFYNTEPVSKPMIFFWAFLNAVCLWIAAYLAVFYCMKIVNFSQPFLVKMKLKISGMVPWLLLGSLLISFAISLPVTLLENCYNCCNMTEVLLDNSTGLCPDQALQKLVLSLIYVMGTLPPFMACLISSVFLISSLVHHLKRLQKNPEGFSKQQLDAHMRAIKTLVSCFLLYSATFVSEISVSLFTSPWTVILSNIVVAAYHSGHAIFLIAMNTKLKQALVKTLHGGTC